MAIETGPNFVTVSGNSRGHDPLERRHVTFIIETPGYWACTGNMPFHVSRRDMKRLQAELGKLIERAKEQT